MILEGSLPKIGGLVVIRAGPEYRASRARKSIKKHALRQFDLAKALVYTSF